MSAKDPVVERLRWLGQLLLLATLGVAGLLIFSKSMQRALDHDEHQFVASAALFARDGLLPYRDFPHFHMPYLVFAYGLLFKLSDQLLLTARLVSILAAWGTLVLVATAALRSLAGLGAPWRHSLACAAVGCLLFNPLFTYTSGLAWNHDLSVLLSLGSFVLLTGRADGRVDRGALGAGVLLGLASGVRLSALPLAAPLVWLALRRGGARQAVALLLGLTLGLAPALICFAQAPSQAWFGNITYAGLNTAWRVETGFEQAMTAAGKLRYLVSDVLADPANGVLLALSAAASLWAARTSALARATWLLLPFLLLGALAPTPSWYQYFYALTPFLLLALVDALASRGASPVLMLVLLGTLAGLGLKSQLAEYRTLSNLADASLWTPSRVHATGLQIDAAAGPGPVLTLSPIFPLEGGRPIDSRQASGPFAFRTAHLLAADERARRGLAGLAELQAAEPPAAVFTGHERSSDAALEAFATQRGLQRVEWAGDGRLYLPGP